MILGGSRLVEIRTNKVFFIYQSSFRVKISKLEARMIWPSMNQNRLLFIQFNITFERQCAISGFNKLLIILLELP